MKKKKKLKCTDCGIRLTPENKTARYHRCKECEKIRYKSVGLKKKKALVEKFCQDPNIRPVEGFNGRYMVSNTGDVYSVTEFGIRKLRPGVNAAGYYLVCLFENGKPKMKSVHQLVGLAFIENKYPYVNKIINHKDGNKLNNHVSNLEWTTFSGNTRHALRTGLQPRGEQIATAKLNNEKVLYIYQQKKRITQKELSQIFGVTVRLIRLVQEKKVWRHIKRYQSKPEREYLSRKRKHVDYTKEPIQWEKPGDRYLNINKGHMLTLIENEDKTYTLFKNNKKYDDIDNFPETWYHPIKKESLDDELQN